MSDDSDDGTYFKGESFFNEKKNRNNYENDYYNIDNENEEEEEECENIYNYYYYNDNEEESFREDDYYESREYDTYNSKYDFENNYDEYYRSKYDYKTYHNNDEYRYINSFNTSYFSNYDNDNNNCYNKEGNDYNNNNEQEDYSVYKGYQYYISSFQTKFRLWLLNTINKDKKDIIFVHDKKINKEIIDTINKVNNKEGKINIDIKDVEIKPIVSNDIDINFTIAMTEEIELFFIKKYIEIKAKGIILYKKYAKFYFNVKQYKLSLTGEYIKNKNSSSDYTILNIEKNNNEDDNDILELSLKKVKFRKIYDENNDEFIDPGESLSKFLNELIECLHNE